MRKALLSLLTIGLSLLGAAHADEPSDWVKCDGYPRPEGAGVTAARIVAAISTAGLFGLPENARSMPAARGQAGVDACSAVLVSPELDRFWARRVALLQARARHHVDAGNLDSALEDLRAAGVAAQGQAAELWYQRSLGVSATLLEAAILTKRGQQDEAQRLALAAADTRPFSATIIGLAAVIFAVDPDLPAEERRILDRLVALNPSLGLMRARALEWGADRNAAADDFERELEYARASSARGESLGAPLGAIARTAVTAFRAGRDERAAELAAELRAGLLLPLPAAPGASSRNAANEMDRVRFAAEQREEAFRQLPIIESYEALRQGNAAAAFARVASGRVAIGPAVFDLLREIMRDPAFAGRAAAFETELSGFEASAREMRVDAISMSRFAEALPPLEQIGGGNRFRRQGWGANGFEDRAAPDGAGRVITFSGGSTITTTEELTLLRAAQLAIENGSTGLVVRSRSDFQRYHVTTYAGAETSRSESGFEIRADIAFVDAASPPAEYAGRVVSAQEVWDALSPIFSPPRERRAR